MPLDKAKEKERKRLYHIANKEKQNERNRLWKLNNPEKVKAMNKKAYWKDREANIERKKLWAENNPKKIKITRWKNLGMKVDDWGSFYNKYMKTTSCELCDMTFGSQEIKKEMKCCDHDHISKYIRFICCQKCNNNLAKVDMGMMFVLLELNRYHKVN